MSRLVNGLLVLARAEAKVTAAAEPLPLGDIVRERLSVWRPAAAERGVRIASEGRTDGGPVVLAGPGHLDQEKSRAFDRFWRGQGLADRSGSGLGLSVVRRRSSTFTIDSIFLPTGLFCSKCSK